MLTHVIVRHFRSVMYVRNGMPVVCVMFDMHVMHAMSASKSVFQYRYGIECNVM